MPVPDEKETVLVRISASGVVQGVGFRPFIYGLAARHGVRGWVCNTSGDVRIEAEGKRKDVESFAAAIRTEAPPLACIESLDISYAEPLGYSIFEIRPSLAQEGKYQLVSPDIATCTPCLNDVSTAGNRRYGYPFTNCTNCGPRFTIIKDIPYDRPLTTMAEFTMCPDCEREYRDPLDRRFHAQPNACPACGPRLALTDNAGTAIDAADIITAAAGLLREGKIVAVKGLGGFLLACNAQDDAAVSLLRQRKRRPSKPFAVMLRDIEEAHRLCHVSSVEEQLLASPQAPIVLLRVRENSSISPGVNPRLEHMGVMLPYTPLHHLLVRAARLPLVMTSGNISEEPIAGDNTEALHRLAGTADFFLMHNRGIHSTYDDSVVMVAGDRPQVIRRARGYAPNPVHLGFDSPQVLACGAEEKNTFCLARGRHAFISQHIGDMENIETLQHYERTVDLYQKLFRVVPETIACDMHPEYLPTKYGLERAGREGLRAVQVQHHHAHIASCLADNGEEGQVIGLAFDGTGYGSDGRIWGGEFLVADQRSFKRAGQLEYLPLPGGAQAIRRPCRTALGYLLALQGGEPPDGRLGFLSSMREEERQAVRSQVEAGLNSPLTSSMGRLFDAVSALADIRTDVDYEAQAAIEMEMAACGAEDEKGIYPFSLAGDGDYTIVLLHELMAAACNDVLRGCRQPVIAMRFHNTVAQMAKDVCLKIRESTGLGTVALSGGCFQNRLLLSKVTGALVQSGFNVLWHKTVPANDGGISLGQVVIAARAA